MAKKSLPLSLQRNAKRLLASGESLLAEGAYPEARQVFLELIRVSAPNLGLGFRFQALARLSQISIARKEWEEAEGYTKAFVQEVKQAGGSAEHLSQSLSLLADVYLNTERYAQAKPILMEAIEAYRLVGDLNYLAAQLANLAIVCKFLGEVQASLERFSESLSIYEKLGDRAAQINILLVLGELLQKLGRGDEAARAYERSLMMARGLSDLEAQFASTKAFANMSLMGGEIKKAYDYYVDFLKELRKYAKNRLYYVALIEFAQVAERLFEFEEASRAYEEIRHSCENNDNFKEIYFSSLLAQASLLQAKGEREQALSHYALVESYVTEARNQDLGFALEINRAQDLLESCQFRSFDESLRSVEERILQDSGSFEAYLSSVFMQRGRVGVLRGEWEFAQESFGRGRELYEKAHDFSHILSASLVLEALRFEKGAQIDDFIQKIAVQIGGLAENENWQVYVQCHFFLAQIHLANHEFDKTVAALDEIRRHVKEEFMFYEHCDALILRAELLSKMHLAGGFVVLEEIKEILESLLQTLEIVEKNENMSRVVSILTQVANLCAISRDDSQARQCISRALKICADYGLRFPLIELYMAAARTHRNDGNQEKAAEAVESATLLCKELGALRRLRVIVALEE